jgi:thioredoxin reductase (NADPH)
MYQMIIVGAGPAGIAMAVEAIKSGIHADDILILEKEESHNYPVRKFYPEEKLVMASYKGKAAECLGELCIRDMGKDELLSYFDEIIEDNHIRVKYHEQVKSIDNKIADQYFLVNTYNTSFLTKTVVMAIGIMGRPNKPKYPLASALKNQIHYDLTTHKIEKSDVLVVGGGDSASEYAQILAGRGNRVSLSYRQPELIRMNERNKAQTLSMEKSGEMNLILGSNIERVDERDGMAHVHFAEDSIENREFDHIVYAIGGSSPRELMESIGITLSRDGVKVSDHFESDIEGLFVVGDISAGKGGGSINMAFNSSKLALKEICYSYLDCNPE